MNLVTLTDEELMKLLQQGKREAFELLYERYAKRLFSFLNRWLHDTERANDLLHDLFIKLIEGPERFDSSKKFSTWIYTLATNLCKNEIRNTNNRKKILESQFHTTEKNTTPSIDQLDHPNFRRELHAFIDELDEEIKTIYLLRFQEELTIPEISKIVNCPEGTVKSRIFYLMKKMADQLKAYNPQN